MLLWPGQRLVRTGVEDVRPMDKAAAGIGEDFGHAVDKIPPIPVEAPGVARPGGFCAL